MLRIEQIKKYIGRCEDVILTSSSDAEALQNEIISIYESQIDEIWNGLESYSSWQAYYSGYTGNALPSINFLKNVKLLKGKLEYMCATLLDEEKQRQDEIELAKLRVQTISLTQNQTNQQTQSTNIAISIEQVFEAIKQIPDEILPQEDKDELEDKISAVEAAKNSKDKGKLLSKIAAVLKYIIDKGIEVGIAVLPYLGEIAKLYKGM